MNFRNAPVALAFASLLLATASCTNEGYDTGDGKYSYLTADFALLHTNGSKAVVAASLDDGTELSIANPFTVDFAAKADTVYRALLYYDKTDGTSAASSVKARNVAQVPVLSVVPIADVKQMHTDPLGIESVWTAKNGKYINMSLLLKSGSADGDNRQTIGVVLESSTVGSDGKRHAVLRLYHDQGSVPEYYTVQQYVSVDAAQVDADIVEIHANTYDGEVVKTVE